ncbi:MAG: ABC transporter ATP-binding protein [Alphaproteobacteria bacterium]|nr:ABC transporter ATP-binding protein [Alphaproteobacteria bacterium]
MDAAALDLREIGKTFRQGSEVLEVLKGVSLQVAPGEIVALLGQSGSGKSTLLHIAGLLEQAERGEVIIGGLAAGRLGDGARTRLRRETIGFVYQFHHLLPEFSALENVMMPMLVAGHARARARKRAAALLDRLGLAARLSHRPARLSGGEQQRVAIARALANEPRVILADEPTGNLDGRTADRVFAELLEAVRELGVAAVIATHNEDLASKMTRTVYLQDGVLHPK